MLELAGLTAAPGQRTFGTLTTRLAEVDVQHPVFLINGAEPGPTLVVTAGVHGAEYASVEAALRLGQTLDPSTLHGQVIVVPIVSPTAFRARSIYVTPEDGKNPNRQFPGETKGTFSQALAYWLFNEVIRRADYFIDLHGGDLVEALVPFVIHFQSENPEVNQASVDMARSFGIYYVLQGSTPGSTYAAASQFGIPSILAEAGGQGIWTEETTELLHQGIRRVMTHLGMTQSGPLSEIPVVLYDRWAWLRSEHDGVFYPKVAAGDQVTAGQDLGRVADVFGNTLQPLTAPMSGVVLFLVTSLAMNSGDPLLAIAG